MPKLLLINPTGIHKVLGNIKATAWPPLNLPYIAAVTPKYYDIEVIDENIEPFKYVEADLVGITTFTSAAYRAYQIAQLYRQRGVPTVMGGIHVSMLPKEALDYCDSVVVGEAESIWPKVLKDFESGNLKRVYEGSLQDLQKLPIPKRDILKNNYYKWGSLQTSRGCPMNCKFCSVTAFNGRTFRRRPLDAVIDELHQIPQKFIMFSDDNIVGYGKNDKEWTFELFSKIIKENIRKIYFAQTSILFGEDENLIKLASRAGLKVVFIGMESINIATLKHYGKNINAERLQQNRILELISKIRKGGIAILGAFVLGSDHDDASIFPSTWQFIKKSHLDIIQTTKPTPLPGTQLWDELQKDSRIINQNFPEAWNDYGLSRLVFEPQKMSREEVYKGFTYLRKTYYKNWETAKRTLSTLLTTKSMTATYLAFALNRSYKKAFKKSDHYQLYSKKNLSDIFELKYKQA